MNEMEEQIESFIFSRKAAMRSEATIECYEYTLRSFADSNPDWPPSANEIRAFLASCWERKLSAVTIRGHWEKLSVWFRWLVAEERLTRNPMERVDRPSTPKLLPRGPRPADVQTLFQHLTQATATDKADIWDFRDLALVAFLYDTGARNIEARTLTFADLYLKRQAAIVLGKGNKERLVTFGRRTQKALQQWLEKHPDDTDLIFITTEGQPMSRWSILRVVKHAAAKAGIPYTITPHDLRHAATLATLDLGANIVDVQGQMGHEDITTTRRYAQASVKHRIRLHDKHSPLDKLDKLAADDW
jgi:integrase/recombinase XerC